MKHRGLKFLFLLLSLVLLIGVLSGMSAFADTQTWTSGATTVTYNDDDFPVTLTVDGTGAMADYANQPDVPWRSYRRAVQSVVIHGGVTSIGRNAFCNFSNMISVSIPGSVTSIGMNAFYGCSSLTSVVIPNGVTSIGAYAFNKCRALTSVVIPNGVTSIGPYAFSSCTGLDGTNLNIPGSVTSIGENAFNGVNFTSVTFEPGVNGTKLTIGDYAFYHYNNSTRLAYGSGNAKFYYENGNEVLERTLMNTLSNKTLTWKSTGFTVTYQPGDGASLKDGIQPPDGYTVDGQNIVKTGVKGEYQIEGLESCFNAPEGKVFDCWKDANGAEYRAPQKVNLTANLTLTAQWKEEKKPDGGEKKTSGGGSSFDLVFNIPGADNSWEYAPGYAPQQAYRVSLAPMQGGSAALGLTTGESGETLNVYPSTTVYVFPEAEQGYTLDKIVWSLIDGSASYDITEAKNFVMPAMDVVVYVTFRPVG